MLIHLIKGYAFTRIQQHQQFLDPPYSFMKLFKTIKIRVFFLTDSCKVLHPDIYLSKKRWKVRLKESLEWESGVRVWSERNEQNYFKPVVISNMYLTLKNLQETTKQFFYWVGDLIAGKETWYSLGLMTVLVICLGSYDK